MPAPTTKEIMASSHQGWGPLRVHRQTQSTSSSPSLTSSPLSPSMGGGSGKSDVGVARRTSNSFSHVKNGSLVSNSIFKQASPTMGPGKLGTTDGIDGKTVERKAFVPVKKEGAQREMAIRRLGLADGSGVIKETRTSGYSSTATLTPIRSTNSTETIIGIPKSDSVSSIASNFSATTVSQYSQLDEASPPLRFAPNFGDTTSTAISSSNLGNGDYTPPSNIFTPSRASTSANSTHHHVLTPPPDTPRPKGGRPSVGGLKEAGKVSASPFLQNNGSTRSGDDMVGARRERERTRSQSPSNIERTATTTASIPHGIIKDNKASRGLHGPRPRMPITRPTSAPSGSFAFPVSHDGYNSEGGKEGDGREDLGLGRPRRKTVTFAPDEILEQRLEYEREVSWSSSVVTQSDGTEDGDEDGSPRLFMGRFPLKEGVDAMEVAELFTRLSARVKAIEHSEQEVDEDEESTDARELSTVLEASREEDVTVKIKEEEEDMFPSHQTQDLLQRPMSPLLEDYLRRSASPIPPTSYQYEPSLRRESREMSMERTMESLDTNPKDAMSPSPKYKHEEFLRRLSPALTQTTPLSAQRQSPTPQTPSPRLLPQPPQLPSEQQPPSPKHHPPPSPQRFEHLLPPQHTTERERSAEFEEPSFVSATSLSLGQSLSQSQSHLKVASKDGDEPDNISYRSLQSRGSRGSVGSFDSRFSMERMMDDLLHGELLSPTIHQEQNDDGDKQREWVQGLPLPKEADGGIGLGLGPVGGLKRSVKVDFSKTQMERGEEEERSFDFAMNEGVVADNMETNQPLSSSPPPQRALPRVPNSSAPPGPLANFGLLDTNVNPSPSSSSLGSNSTASRSPNTNYLIMPKSLSLNSLYELPGLDGGVSEGFGDLGGLLDRKNSVMMSSLSRRDGPGSFRQRITRDGIQEKMRKKLMDSMVKQTTSNQEDPSHLLTPPTTHQSVVPEGSLNSRLEPPSFDYEEECMNTESPLERLVTEMREPAKSSGEEDNLSAMASASSPAGMTPAEREKQINARRRAKGRGRRSLSTGDALDIEKERAKPRPEPPTHEDADVSLVSSVAEKGVETEPVLPQVVTSTPSTDFIELRREIEYIASDKTYRAVERPEVIFATDTVGTLGNAGDVDCGKAWKKVRTSDASEAELRLQRAETVRNTFGTVFVKLVKIALPNLPIPAQPTFFTCVMSNGEADVSTKDAFRLSHEVRLNQEWELNFSPHLTCSLRFQLQINPTRDFHLLPPRHPTTPSTQESKELKPRSGFGRLFHHSPKKAAKASPVRDTPSPAPIYREPLLYHCRNDGVFARAVVDFASDSLKGCYLRKRQIAVPCASPILHSSNAIPHRPPDAPSQSSTTSSSGSSTVIGSSDAGSTKGGESRIGFVELEILRLPHLPGVGRSSLPSNLDKAMFGLRSMVWHDSVFHEGFLNHRRRDLTWRRQFMQLKGARLRAFNDVVTSPLFQLDLTKVVAIEDNNLTLLTSASTDNEDEYMHVPRSFRLVFNDRSEVHFYAGTDAEKSEWMDKLKTNIHERMPDRPVWTEVLRKELQKQKRKTVQTTKAPLAPPKDL